MKREGMMIGRLWIHRKEQWDLEIFPWLCMHWKTPGKSQRVFVLGWRVLRIGKWSLT